MKTTISSMAMRFPDEGTQVMFIATRADGRPAGTVTGKEVIVKCGEDTVRTVTFARMWVEPTFRRNGVGRRLLEAMEKRAAQCVSISCYVKPSNVDAINFYKKCGFKLAFIYDDGDMCFSKPVRKK